MICLKYTIIRAYHLPEGVLKLVEESNSEGFRHLKRLVDDYNTGTNRFDKQGEALFIACVEDQIVGVCGLNQDPYLHNEAAGRVRRLYISKDFRRFGVGRLLMVEVIEEAKKHYKTLSLKTDNPVADSFYCSLGFSKKIIDERATHCLRL